MVSRQKPLRRVQRHPHDHDAAPHDDSAHEGDVHPHDHTDLETVLPDQHHGEDHAARHGSGGADAVSPASIGAAPDPHGDEAHSEAKAPDPHGDGAHSKDYVDNQGATPQDQADTRANQPAADAVPVGSRYWVTDEDIYERSDGTSWSPISTTVAYSLTWPSNAPSTVVLGPTSGLFNEGWRVGGQLIGWRDATLSGDQASWVATVVGTYDQRATAADRTHVAYLELGTSAEDVSTRLVTFDDTDGVNYVGIEFDAPANDFPVQMVFRGERSTNADMRVVTNSDRSNVAAYSPNAPGANPIRVVGSPLTVDEAPVGANDAVRKSALDNHTGDTTNPHSVTASQTGASADPHGDSAHSRDYDADFVNVTGDTMSGDLDAQDSMFRPKRTVSGTDYRAEYYVDTNGDLVILLRADGILVGQQFRQRASQGDTEVTGDLLVDGAQVTLNHANLTLDGADLDVRKSSHGGNIILDGYIQSFDASITANTFMEVQTFGDRFNAAYRIVDNDVGIYFYAQGIVGLAQQAHLPRLGTAAEPALSIGEDGNGDANIGLMREFSNSVDITIKGVLSYVQSDDRIRPDDDGVKSLGGSSFRWEDVWAVDGTINTSDTAYKSNMAGIDTTAATDRIRRVADAAITFTWKNSDRGRRHAGFDSDKLDEAVGNDHAAYVDPAILAGELTADPNTDQPTQVGAKGIRSHELIPDLYAALAHALDRIDQLEAQLP